MQIPGNPFPTGPGFLQRPQTGARQQASADLQAKANAPGAEGAQARPRRPAGAARPQAPTKTAPTKAAPTGAVPTGAVPRSDAPGLARAQTLEQAVRALADEGRLPPRGSLVDRSA